MLNTPISLNKKIENYKDILIIGTSNSIVESLPLYYSFLKQGMRVNLANLTHTDFKTIANHVEPIILTQNLVGATPVIKQPSEGFVEGYLSQYFKVTIGDKIIWMLNRTHVQELKKNLERLIEYLKIDYVVFVDGGIDSMMIGDEGKDVLTPKFVDTTIMLAAIQQVEQIRENCCYVCVNDNSKNQIIINNMLSTISSQGGFYGGCYMLDYMNSYKFMKNAYAYIKNNNNISAGMEHIIKLTDSDYEEDEIKEGMIQFLFFNPIALAYNNVVIGNILEATNHYDIVQIIAPFVNKKN